MRSLFVILAGLLLFASCKEKKKEEVSTIADCILYETLNADTNFIPHKKNNFWDYCFQANFSVSNNSKVIYDSLINNKYHFTIQNTNDPQTGVTIVDYHYTIDSLNHYYLTSGANSFADTIRIINPVANNGDTIYKNPAKKVTVVVVNKNETYQTIHGCYHVVEIRPFDNTNTTFDYAHHYYKKGLGEVFFTHKIGTVYACILKNATIH